MHTKKNIFGIKFQALSALYGSVGISPGVTARKKRAPRPQARENIQTFGLAGQEHIFKEETHILNGVYLIIYSFFKYAFDSKF